MEKDPTIPTKPGVGLDVGTAFIVAARQQEGNIASIKSVRDVFIDVPNEKLSKGRLEKQGISYLELDGKTLVVGDNAMKLAAVLNRKPRRPLQSGVVSSEEKDAFPVLARLVHSVTGDPLVEDERVIYSVPAPSATNPEFDTIYHQSVFNRILSSIGYSPEPITEGLAAAYGSGSTEEFLISISMGAGMCNVAITYMLMPIAEYSIPYGGDWLDEKVAEKLNKPSAVCVRRKESDGFSLRTGESDFEVTYRAYYTHLLQQLFEVNNQQLIDANCPETIFEPAHIVVTGGTTRPGDFEWLLLKIANETDFAVNVESITVLDQPSETIAKGLLIATEL